MKRIFIITILLLNILNSYSQDYKELIIGDWILKDMAEPGRNYSDIYSIRISFLENNTCYRSLNLFEKSSKLIYFIDNDKLIIDNTVFKIDSISNGILILKDIINPEYYSTYVRQKKPFINKDSIAVYYYDTISITFDEEFIPRGLITVRHSYNYDSLQLIKYPELKSNMNISSYLLQEVVYSNKLFKEYNPRKLEVSFTILENGKMSEISVVDENKDKWLEEKIYKVFKGLETKWAPLSIENKIYKYKMYFNLIIIYRPKSDNI